MALVSTVECPTARGHIAGANRPEAIPFPPRRDDAITDVTPLKQQWLLAKERLHFLYVGTLGGLT
jgi:hypothetical protein